jgi:RHS repeat-associated protein
MLTYDPYDYRIAKTDSTGTRKYLLEGEHLEALLDGANNWKAMYLRGAVIDEIVNAYYFDTNGRWVNYTFHHDALQSVLGISGHEGTVLQAISYGPFGEKINVTGSAPANYLHYTGRETDPDTGLYNYRARLYDPTVGRFITEDPKGFDAGVNFYIYCNNNGVNGNDPMGLDNMVYYLGSATPVHELTNTPGMQYLVQGNSGVRYPLGQLFTVPKGGFTDIVSEKQVGFLMLSAANKISAEHDSLPLSIPNPTKIVNWSATGKPWDFKWQTDYLDPKSLYLMNGVAQQYDVAGNALWAAGMKKIGVPELAAKAGAEYYSLKSTGKLDDARDQAGISYGYQYFDTSSTYNSFSFAGADTSSAAGGYVIYPNKPNTNMTRSVYNK